MRLDVISIFPDYLAPLRLSLVGKAVEASTLDLRVHDLRTWTHDRHRTVDDTPYGGGAGMVMRPEPWGEALDALAPEEGPQPRLVVPTPAGTPFTQGLAEELAAEPWLVFACGRYEGIDHRVVEYAARRMRVDEVSIGDYVLAGGEVAVLVIVEAVARLLPGVLGNPESLVEESHSAGLLEYPVYTKPSNWRDLDVPPVLLSGHHGQIARWRRDEALRRTIRRRPDLLRRLLAEALDAHDREVLGAEGWSDQG
ncbi:tRNA (guanosine(37)-N1)-methyltransferase TrmD [Actinopolymorpha alba]|uniref:tRNA (guanosine(37)-N1)-methyltransferase TrmD n=1 Tax=Actinopolymorpha alba TaxID=533267 RepID=UPI00037E0E6A|nr:tRNA (guanosine(37)-N1)-methyltransferase TrmD [Actinopolymorpha alba]